MSLEDLEMIPMHTVRDREDKLKNRYDRAYEKAHEKLKRRNAGLTKDRKDLIRAIKAYQSMNTVYRLGSRPTQKALSEIMWAEDKLAEIQKKLEITED